MKNPSTAEAVSRPVHPLVSRFTIAILASLLCGVSCGPSLSPDVATMCGLTGLAGFTAYFGLSLAARARQRRKSETLQTSAEYRLLAHAVSALLPPNTPYPAALPKSRLSAMAYDGGGWEWRRDEGPKYTVGN